MTSTTPSALTVTVAVLSRTARTGEVQGVEVRVTDARGRPVDGATGRFVVHYDHGDRGFDLPPTDRSGRATRTFTVEEVRSGSEVTIDVTVQSGSDSASGRTGWTAR